MNRSCQNCHQSFTPSTYDINFYARMGFPLPQNCPSCRYQHRLSFRNENKLYKRKCDGTGQEIISIFSNEKPFPVYSQKYWWSDQWNPKEYGRNFDFSRPFFEQFKELFNSVPRLALNNSNSENCEYTNQSQNNKNCYLIVASNNSEDCYYGAWFQNCRDSIDCLYLEESELCYEILYGRNCFGCTYSQNIENCSDIHFSKNLIGCSNCFACINLRNKQYHIFNKAYSKENYFKTLPQIKKQIHNFYDFFLKFPFKYYHGKNTENFSGDYVQEVKNSYQVFNCRYNENTNYCYDAWKARNCLDLTETLINDYCLELEGCTENVDTAFCMKNHNTHSSRYSAHCFSSKNLFGCVGIKSSEYCILNKQYSKSEYQEILPQIIEHIKKHQEWGRYFPKNLSAFGYNETVAQEYFPLTKVQALSKGFNWKDDLPESTSTPNQQIQKCQISGKTFKLIPQEISFYQKLNLKPPTRCPQQRHKDRMALRNPRFLNNRNCQCCRKPLKTTYSSNRPEIIHCEQCYVKRLI